MNDSSQIVSSSDPEITTTKHFPVTGLKKQKSIRMGPNNVPIIKPTPEKRHQSPF